MYTYGPISGFLRSTVLRQLSTRTMNKEWVSVVVEFKLVLLLNYEPKNQKVS